MQQLTFESEYVRKALAAYRSTPGTTGQVRRADRLLAAQLFTRGVPLKTIENALILTSARRLRPPEALPLSTIRSFAYFLPVIEELLELSISDNYFQYLRQRLQQR